MRVGQAGTPPPWGPCRGGNKEETEKMGVTVTSVHRRAPPSLLFLHLPLHPVGGLGPSSSCWPPPAPTLVPPKGPGQGHGGRGRTLGWSPWVLGSSPSVFLAEPGCRWWGMGGGRPGAASCVIRRHSPRAGGEARRVRPQPPPAPQTGRPGASHGSSEPRKLRRDSRCLGRRAETRYITL